MVQLPTPSVIKISYPIGKTHRYIYPTQERKKPWNTVVLAGHRSPNLTGKQYSIVKEYGNILFYQNVAVHQNKSVRIKTEQVIDSTGMLRTSPVIYSMHLRRILCKELYEVNILPFSIVYHFYSIYRNERSAI